VYRLDDGSYVLRLENLDIFNGPALYVYAVAAADANDDETIEETGFLYRPNLIQTSTALLPSGANGSPSTSPRRLCGRAPYQMDYERWDVN
jgi:hypothetical protein